MRTHNEAARMLASRSAAAVGRPEGQAHGLLTGDPSTVARHLLYGLVPLEELDSVMGGICGSVDNMLTLMARAGVEIEAEDEDKLRGALFMCVAQELTYAWLMAETDRL